MVDSIIIFAFVLVILLYLFFIYTHTDLGCRGLPPEERIKSRIRLETMINSIGKERNPVRRTRKRN